MRKAALFLLVSVLVAEPVKAQVWDVPVNDALEREYSLGAYRIASPFILSDPTTVYSFSFWGVDHTGGGFEGIYWEIFADQGGVPEGSLASGSSFQRTAYTPISGVSAYQHDIDIGPLPLGVGTFWIALHHGSQSDYAPGSPYTWVASTQQGSRGWDWLSSYDSYDNLKWRTTSESDYLPSLQVYGSVVPEPSTVILLGTGLMGLGVVLWRRREEDV